MRRGSHAGSDQGVNTLDHQLRTTHANQRVGRRGERESGEVSPMHLCVGYMLGFVLAVAVERMEKETETGLSPSPRGLSAFL
jgi:hypothetical protein